MDNQDVALAAFRLRVIQLDMLARQIQIDEDGTEDLQRSYVDNLLQITRYAIRANVKVAKDFANDYFGIIIYLTANGQCPKHDDEFGPLKLQLADHFKTALTRRLYSACGFVFEHGLLVIDLQDNIISWRAAKHSIQTIRDGLEIIITTPIVPQDYNSPDFKSEWQSKEYKPGEILTTCDNFLSSVII